MVSRGPPGDPHVITIFMGAIKHIHPVISTGPLRQSWCWTSTSQKPASFGTVERNKLLNERHKMALGKWKKHAHTTAMAEVKFFHNNLTKTTCEVQMGPSTCAPFYLEVVQGLIGLAMISTCSSILINLSNSFLDMTSSELSMEFHKVPSLFPKSIIVMWV